MHISSVGLNMQNTYSGALKSTTSFGHAKQECAQKTEYTTKQKALVVATSALGVCTSLAILSKAAGYSLKPSKMFKNIKNSYLAKVEYKAPQVVSIGVGTCLGGLAGGYMIDKDPESRKAKRREAVMQFGNISIPICTVGLCGEIGSKIGKFAQGAMSIAGLFGGVYLANNLMNKLSNKMFHNKNEERNVKPTDFSAHIDDMVLSAGYIANTKEIHAVGRIIPLALMIPGYEVGTKQAHK
jgi:hypothetical protein